ncbi:MAG: CBS domain-containing protein [Ktedonobacteraceae bacterium]
MIVREVMTTRLALVTPDTTLSHAANLLRQYQFHHLPVVRMPAHSQQWPGFAEEMIDTTQCARTALPLFEGLLTSQDIDLASALAAERADRTAPGGTLPSESWQEKPVRDVMRRDVLTVTPSTSVAAAAQLLVERGLNCLPVVEYDDVEEENLVRETRALLVGLLTRSDLLIALARSLGADEPGVEVHIPFPAGDMTHLAQTLLLAAELHIPVRSSIAAPLAGNVSPTATVRLGTIHPAPLLIRLREAHIPYTVASTPWNGDVHAERTPPGQSAPGL